VSIVIKHIAKQQQQQQQEQQQALSGTRNVNTLKYKSQESNT
jgi:hypothetical protein